MNVMMRKLLLFFMLLASMAVNAQTKSAVQEITDGVAQFCSFSAPTKEIRF